MFEIKRDFDPHDLYQEESIDTNTVKPAYVVTSIK